MTTKILNAKIIGLCSKHRENKEKSIEDILTDKNGNIVQDKDIACIQCEFSEKFKLENGKIRFI